MTTPALWRIATPMEQEPSTPSAQQRSRKTLAREYRRHGAFFIGGSVNPCLLRR
jgi:hypothetical protein